MRRPTSRSRTIWRAARARAATPPARSSCCATPRVVRPDLPSLTVDLARALEGAGRAARGARRAGGAGGAAARRGGGAGPAGEAAASPGRARGGAGAPAPCAGAAPAGSGAAPLHRSGRARIASTPTSRRARIWRAGTPPTSPPWCRPPRRRRAGAAAAPARRGGGRRRRSGAWCCSIGAWCACTATAWPRPSRSGWSRSTTDRGAEDNKQFYVRYTPGRRRGRDPPGAHLPPRHRRARADPRRGRARRRGSLRALVRPLLRQPRRGGALRGAARRRRPRGAVPGRRRVGQEPDGRLLRRSAVHRRGDPQAAVGLHADRSARPHRSTPTRRTCRGS